MEAGAPYFERLVVLADLRLEPGPVVQVLAGESAAVPQAFDGAFEADGAAARASAGA